MKRAEITAIGEVQRVGYRDIVESHARKLGINGFVQNVKPYDVKIVAEAEEEKLKEFIKKIKVKKTPIDVEELKIKYAKPTKKFKYFEIKRGDWKEELGERMDVGGKMLYGLQEGQETLVEGQKGMIEGQKGLIKGQKTMVEKQSIMINKQDENTKILKEFKDETKESFNAMEKRYGEISEGMNKGMQQILKVLHEDRVLFTKAVNKFGEAIEKIGTHIPSKGGN